MFLFSVVTSFQYFAAPAAGCIHGFFGLPTWYQYLPSSDFTGCQITQFNYPSDIAPVVLAAVDIALTIAGMIAVGFVIWGGIQYVISQGEPDKTAGAKNTITNALVGLVIAGASIVVVSFIGATLG